MKDSHSFGNNSSKNNSKNNSKKCFTIPKFPPSHHLDHVVSR